MVCYWRMLLVIRRQAQVMASHSVAGSNTAQAQSHHIQTNVIKTDDVTITILQNQDHRPRDEDPLERP